MCITLYPYSTVPEYPGAKFAGDGLVLKGPGNNMLHNWVWSPSSLACCTGPIRDWRPAKERQRYINVSHWMGASLESGLDVAQPHNFPRQWTYTTLPPDHNIPNYCSGGGGGGTHYVRVMGRLRGIDTPFFKALEKNLDFRPLFFAQTSTLDPPFPAPSTLESAGPREPTYHLHWRSAPPWATAATITTRPPW